MSQCKRCIMDDSNDPDLLLDDAGICNHCRTYERTLKSLPEGLDRERQFQSIVNRIKRAGEGKKYDCIIGVSGGVDSTYLCYLAKQQGLRALLTHCDNGWNSELSVKNIENISAHTGFDLWTEVLYWEEFKDIQLSFFKAGVVDLELPYEYALINTSKREALKYGVKYVLTGHNVATEGTFLPKSWRHDKTDIRNIKAIHRRFGTRPMRTFPHFSFLKQLCVDKKIQSISLLNYVDYNKDVVKNVIAQKMAWRDYGGKHYESIFTRFYQGYILREKFKIDKRQFHLSVLVQSGQMTRNEALLAYATPAYDPDQLELDKEYVLKKLGFTIGDFETYLRSPIHKHLEYPSTQIYWNQYFRIVNFFRPLRQLFARG